MIYIKKDGEYITVFIDNKWIIVTLGEWSRIISHIGATARAATVKI